MSDSLSLCCITLYEACLSSSYDLLHLHIHRTAAALGLFFVIASLAAFLPSHLPPSRVLFEAVSNIAPMPNPSLLSPKGCNYMALSNDFGKLQSIAIKM